MKTVIATKDQIVVSFSVNEFLALSNSLNEVLNNSSVDEQDCSARIGVCLAELKSLHAEISSVLNSRVFASTENLEAQAE